ncbi:hypothetical protein M501DRAFT_930430 [Patellaria atrata CBS 101060]|uniref:Disease resistance R13L4/SHOC-2-like LRR domain-containing protein n=1 Tax=Patellaria atrata CBS 101060 TaxID=1346257 RepID=A0A9P4SDS6_9PEZI|nr:hypothetical protein M501DRAFT_930430 [Patellaria atrata CBS 101060]
MSYDELVANKPVTDDDLIALAKEAIEAAREETRRSGADTDSSTKDLQQPGITIDLGHRYIKKLPDEVIDIIKDEIERLALSHNSITSFPLKIGECTRLRYLNVRYNFFREFPKEILALTSLEILDISKNKLKILPEEISSLTSLKVLAIQKNKIERLPLSLGDINSLQVLKLDGNVITFPPPEVWRHKKDTPSPSNDNERDTLIAIQVKKFLKQQSTREKLKIESEGESSESNVETPRPPPKRIISGRFPVKPSLSGIEAFEINKSESPNQAPPVPARSHFRNPSQQSITATTTVKRPGLAPLVITNERNRSHSESVMSASLRSKRMGMVTRKTTALSTFDESQTKRSSHFRGWSHGSAMSGTSLANGSSSRPLSDLIEHKRKSRAGDTVVEAAKGVHHALAQLESPVTTLIANFRAALRGVDDRNISTVVTMVFSQVNVLKQQLDNYEFMSEDEEVDAVELSGSIHVSSQRCVRNFSTICGFVRSNAVDLVHCGNPRHIRSLLFLLHGSMIEIRNACSELGLEFSTNSKISQGSSQAVNVPQNQAVLRRHPRSNVPIHANLPSRFGAHLHGLDNHGSNYSSRTNTLTTNSVGTATPRSGESFNLPGSAVMSRSNTMQGLSEIDDDRLFEQIYKKINTACSIMMDVLPSCRAHFSKTKENAKRDMDGGATTTILIQTLSRVIDRADEVINAARVLSMRLQTIRLKDPFVRNQQDFWQLCTAYVQSWADFVTSVKALNPYGLITEQVRLTMKPIQPSVKDVSLAINSSPWSHLATRSADPAATVESNLSAIANANNSSLHLNTHNLHPHPNGSQYAHSTTSTPISSYYSTAPAISAGTAIASGVPPTPLLSAALGNAALATVPNTPLPGSGGGLGSASGPGPSGTANQNPGVSQTGYFSGNVFERAERLIASAQGPIGVGGGGRGR